MRLELTDRIRLYLVAGVFSIVLVTALLLLVLLLPRAPFSVDPVLIRFSFNTLFLVAYGIHVYRHLRKSWRFRAIFVCFLAFHVFVVGAFWAAAGGLPIRLLGLLGFAEFALLGITVYWVLGALPDFRVRKARSPWIPTL
jgi:hypothetical protein